MSNFIVALFTFITLLIIGQLVWTGKPKSSTEKSYDYVAEAIRDPDKDVYYKDGQLIIEHHPERKAEREAFNKLSREEKNAIGISEHWGTCDLCGDSWKWKPNNHAIYRNKTMGYAGLCNECWDKLTPEERIGFLESHLKSYGGEEDIDWDLVRKTARTGQQ